MWAFKQNADSALGTSLCGATKLTKSADLDQCKYSWYASGFDSNGDFTLFNGSGFGIDIIIIVADVSWFVYIANK